MKTLLLVVTLGAALAVSGCGANAKDASLSPATGSAFTEFTLPQGTKLPLSLTSSVASDTSLVKDAVTAELTHAITINGRDVAARRRTTIRQGHSGRWLRPPYGTGHDRFRFTFLRAGNTQYNVETAGLSPRARSITQQEVRLSPGADVTTYLTVPLTVRVVRN